MYSVIRTKLLQIEYYNFTVKLYSINIKFLSAYY